MIQMINNNFQTHCAEEAESILHHLASASCVCLAAHLSTSTSAGVLLRRRAMISTLAHVVVVVWLCII